MKRCFSKLATLWVLLLGTSFSALAQRYAVIHEFSSTSQPDGAAPYGGLIASGGTIYGTTTYGGKSGYGCIFKFTRKGNVYSVIKDFAGTDGANPTGELAEDGDTLYGTTSTGGDSNDGVIFKVKTDGTGYTVLKHFYGSDGWSPTGGLVVSEGTIYGTAAYGGDGYYGVIFRINTNGTDYTVLKHFNGEDGAYPYSGLILSGNTLYGTTGAGGWREFGSGWADGEVFKINTAGTDFTVLKTFTGNDGAGPMKLTLSKNTLFGTTESGGKYGLGIVFRMKTDGTGYDTLREFSGGKDGARPNGGLILLGNFLFGTTRSGGNPADPTYGNGVVFALNTQGRYFLKLKNFNNVARANPWSGLVFSGNTFYGATLDGGLTGNGTLYTLKF